MKAHICTSFFFRCSFLLQLNVPVIFIMLMQTQDVFAKKRICVQQIVVCFFFLCGSEFSFSTVNINRTTTCIKFHQLNNTIERFIFILIKIDKRWNSCCYCNVLSPLDKYSTPKLEFKPSTGLLVEENAYLNSYPIFSSDIL